MGHGVCGADKRRQQRHSFCVTFLFICAWNDSENLDRENHSPIGCLLLSPMAQSPASSLLVPSCLSPKNRLSIDRVPGGANGGRRQNLGRRAGGRRRDLVRPTTGRYIAAALEPGSCGGCSAHSLSSSPFGPSPRAMAPFKRQEERQRGLPSSSLAPSARERSSGEPD
jgi:hypothetical protein